jgi:CheY-like chemotaxis protein
MMPGMDGIEATEKIREIGTDYASKIPIIALTANAIAGNEKMFLALGFQDFLSKPIDISRLDAVIRQWVRDKTMEWNIPIAENTFESTYDQYLTILNFKIEGVDLEAGLDRFSQDDDAYIQVLRSYVANTRDLLNSIEDVNKENLNDYIITVHGLKGSSYSICANLVGEKAEALEMAAKEGDFEYLYEKTPDLLQTALNLLAALEEMLAKLSELSLKSVKFEPDKDLLAKILQACYTYDMQTIEAAVKELERYEYKTNGELVPWMWENVQQFNIDKIIEKLSKMNLSKDNT